MEFRRILVPTDFSRHASAAIDLAVALASRFGAELIVVHVVSPSQLAWPEIDSAVFAELRSEVLDRRRRQLQDCVQSLGKDRRVDSRLLEGVPFTEILECAKRERADLIVMGTQGLTGLKHVLLGSTTERVVRLAGIPVLTTRSPS